MQAQNQQDEALQKLAGTTARQAVKTGAKIGWKATRLAFSGLFRMLVASLGSFLPILLGITVLFISFLVFHMIVFGVSREIIDDGNRNRHDQGVWGRIVSIFHVDRSDAEWTLEDDHKLHTKYLILGDKWKDGLESHASFTERHSNNYVIMHADGTKETPNYDDVGADWEEEINSGMLASQESQARPYRLPWSVLAGIDRMVGDPVMSGEENRKANPEKHYEALKPEFEWETKSITKTIKYYECRTKIGKDGKKSVNCVPKSKTFHTNYKVLTKVKTYVGEYNIKYKEVKIEDLRRTRMPDGGTAETGKIVRGWQVESNSMTGPFFQKYVDLLTSYGVTEELELETPLQIAMNIDESYEIDLMALGASSFHYMRNTQMLDLTYTDSPGPKTRPAGGSISSYFGIRRNPTTGQPGEFHTGIDLAISVGTPVRSFQNGVVVLTGWHGGYGNAIIVDHGAIRTLYAHLSTINVNVGQEVLSGDTIGLSGNTGRSTGPHLHFEVQVVENGRISYENPEAHFKFR